MAQLKIVRYIVSDSPLLARYTNQHVQIPIVLSSLIFLSNYLLDFCKVLHECVVALHLILVIEAMHFNDQMQCNLALRQTGSTSVYTLPYKSSSQTHKHGPEDGWPRGNRWLGILQIPRSHPMRPNLFNLFHIMITS